METSRIYMDAAFQLGGLINEIWGFYQTVTLAVLAGLIFSPAVRPRQPIGRVLLVVLGLGAFFCINAMSIATQGAHLDALLQAASDSLEGQPGYAAASVPPPAVLQMLGVTGNAFDFNWETSIIVHIVIDVCVLVATAWIMLSGPPPKEDA